MLQTSPSHYSLLSISLFLLSIVTLLTQTWATISKFWVEGSQASMTFGLVPVTVRFGIYEICTAETDDDDLPDFRNASCESAAEVGLDSYEQFNDMDGRGWAFLYFSAPACCLFSSMSVMMNGMMIGMEKKSVRQLIWITIITNSISSLLGSVGSAWYIITYSYNVGTLKYEIPEPEPAASTADQSWSDMFWNVGENIVKETYNDNVQDSFKLGPASIVFLVGSVIGLINTFLAVLVYKLSKDFCVLDSEKSSTVGNTSGKISGGSSTRVSETDENLELLVEKHDFSIPR